LHTNTVLGRSEFNGAQLEMLTYGLNIGVMSNQFLAWTGGGLYTATNVTGPWVTNPGVSPLLLTNRTEARDSTRSLVPLRLFERATGESLRLEQPEGGNKLRPGIKNPGRFYWCAMKTFHLFCFKFAKN